jgi:FkbM family methyltransferase
MSSTQSDPDALRGVIDVQARELLRLRRALVAMRSVATERLRILDRLAAERGLRVAPAISDMNGTTASMISTPESIEETRTEIQRLRSELEVATVRSMWRRIGRKAGLAKALWWESIDWQPEGAGGSAQGDGNAEASDLALKGELARLRGFAAELRLSRWRQLGHRLRLERRMSWDGPAKAGAEKLDLRSVFVASDPRPHRSSYEGFIEYSSKSFIAECRAHAVDVVLDVGANTGQFASGLRRSGFQGQILSFEPLSAAHQALRKAAENDPLWTIMDRCAVGATAGSASINIAGNSASSSLLPMLDRHKDAAPHSAYEGSEECPVVTLDDVIDSTFRDRTTLFGLKIDTQGFEAQVLAGLSRHRGSVKVILCELSLVPLYDGGPVMTEVCRILADLGYRCVALSPEFEDPRSGELLQVDGVFVRRDS